MARNLRLLLLVATGLALLVFLVIPRSVRKDLKLAACFDNVHGLREGATVSIAGVGIGRVTAVRAQPDRKDCLARVEMTISTPYELRIPGDATVQLSGEIWVSGGWVSGLSTG